MATYYGTSYCDPYTLKATQETSSQAPNGARPGILRASLVTEVAPAFSALFGRPIGSSVKGSEYICGDFLTYPFQLHISPNRNEHVCRGMVDAAPVKFLLCS